MIVAQGWTGKRVVVVGLGRAGQATLLSLQAGGADVIAWDDSAEARGLKGLEGVSIQDPRCLKWETVDGLFLSPGIPSQGSQAHPAALEALRAGIPFLNDSDLLFQSMPSASFIGVTGTNGKSTTTALICHLLETAGRPVQRGGNIGTAALSLDPFQGHGIYVLELSSYQLESLREVVFSSVVLVNLSPDHLDRHGTVEAYVQAKEHLFDRVTEGRALSVDDPLSRQMFAAQQKRGGGILYPFSCRDTQIPLHVKEGILYDASAGLGGASGLLDLKQTLALGAEHNWQNALAAYAAVKFLNLPQEKLVRGFQTFPGLEHRQEKVLTHQGCVYINDSKATNMDSALQALKAFEGIYWIVGGKPKKGDDFRLALPYASKIRKVYAIGEAAGMIQKSLFPDKAVEICHTLEVAVRRASQEASKACVETGSSGVVLLSPACASYDQFKNFEDRGQVFKKLVRGLTS